MITDPWFYAAAIPAVLIFAISKGGFGGGLGLMAVPMMALVVSPIQAAAIMLPILCIMDATGFWAFRGKWSWYDLKLLLPATMLGLFAGFLLFEYMSPPLLRLILGTVALVFTLHHWLTRYFANKEQQPFPDIVAYIAAAGAGFTSFIAHSGGPFINMYLLRRNLDRTTYVATTVFYFMVVNYVKVVPYAVLGQFDSTNLLTALVLMPLAPVGVYTGYWLHKNISDRLFFQIAYTLLFVVGLRLIYDGLTGL